MRKRITPAISLSRTLEAEGWIDLEGIAEIQATSEHPNHLLEKALLPGFGSGWRAAEKGDQTIRILFDNPQSIQQIYLVFTEDQNSRTQEFVLRAGPNSNAPLQEIVRQQYNFTPISSEVEEYHVDLKEIRLLELVIRPSINGNGTASLTELRLR